MFASYNSQRRPSAPVRSGRKVFENAMVAHVWAQQSHSEGRSNNGNFYFHGDTIYSYGRHFPIARFSTDKSVVWFTSRGYSVSTSGHIRYTQDALHGLPVTVIRVPDLGQFDEKHVSAEQRETIERQLMRAQDAKTWNAFQKATGKRKTFPANAAQIVARLDAKDEAQRIAAKLKRARETLDETSKARAYIDLAPSVSNENAPPHPTPYYVATSRARDFENMRSDIAKARAALVRQATKSASDAARIRKASAAHATLTRLRDVWLSIVAAMESSRDEDADRRQIRDALGALETGARCDYWFEPMSFDAEGEATSATETEILGGRIRRALQIGFTAEQIAPLMSLMHARLYYRESDRSTAESIRIVHARAYPDSNRVTATEWQDGKGATSQYGFTETFVRRNGDTLQTSRGASCPFAHAVIAFLKAQECRSTGTTWKRNGQQIRVGHFNVDAIDEQGNMRAGCHELKWEEMLRLAVREVPHLVKPSFGLPALLDL